MAYFCSAKTQSHRATSLTHDYSLDKNGRTETKKPIGGIGLGVFGLKKLDLFFINISI
jgi:hypothetical protein